MRKSPATSTIVPFRSKPATSYGRRPLAPLFGHLICLALIKHNETDNAVFVSDDGDPIGAVWLPKALLVIDPVERGRFVVVTLSQALAGQKRLYPRFIDNARLADGERERLAEAEAVAARTRNRLRRHRDALPFPGRNAFA